MKEEPYSKREADIMIDGITTHFKEVHDNIMDKLELILNQTTQHNGRLRAIEYRQAWLTGAIAGLSPVTLWLVYQTVQHLMLK